MVAGFVLLAGLAALLCPDVARAAPEWAGAQPGELRVLVELATEVPADQADAFSAAINRLAPLVLQLDDEQAFTQGAFSFDPDAEFTVAIEPEGDAAADLLWAMGQAHGKYKAAEAAGDRSAMSSQLAATKSLALQAADQLRAQADADERAARSLEDEPLARRRSPAAAQSFAGTVLAQGLSDEHRALLQQCEYTPPDVERLERTLGETPAEQWGASLVEVYDGMADRRRKLARFLETYARSTTPPVASRLAGQFLLVNPRDTEQTITLEVRRIAMPPDWRLSVSNADSRDAEPRVRESAPGQTYKVTLPAGGETRIASVVEPRGPLGHDTAARWAVEAYIGDEMLGGMVHELNVPAAAATPAAAPAAPAQTVAAAIPSSPAPVPAPAPPARPWWAIIGATAGAGLLLVLLAGLILRNRRRHTAA